MNVKTRKRSIEDNDNRVTPITVDPEAMIFVVAE